MTQKELLLLRDLCARLPYGPIVYVDENLPRLKLGAATRVWEYIAVDKPCKPYLRPISSMTDEEEKEYKHLVAFSGSPNGAANFTDWLNKKMFAYRTIDGNDGKDMFELGVALKVTEENNPYR